MSLNEIFKILLKRIVLVAAVPFIAMSAVAYYSYAVLPDTYTAVTTLYVLNRQSESIMIGNSDLDASLSLVADYKKLITSRSVTQAVADRLELGDLKAFRIEVLADANTRVIDLSVTGTDAGMAANVANMLADKFSEVVVEIMRVENVSIVDRAYPPEAPSGPPRGTYTMLAVLAGILASAFTALGMETLRTTVGSPQEAEELLGVPVLGRVPFYREKRKRK